MTVPGAKEAKLIHYHGTPITPRSELQKLAGKNFCISYFEPRDVQVCHEIGQSVMLDNGAYSAWKKNLKLTWYDYYVWCERWLDYHTTWAVIPDVVDGEVEDNDWLIDQWPHGDRGAPVWHLHEPISRLLRLCERWPRVCFGSSDMYSNVDDELWTKRMNQAFDAIAPNGNVPVWTHMLRGLKLSGGPYPFASVDSTNVARNFKTKYGAKNLAEYWDAKQCPARWQGSNQMELPVPERHIRAALEDHVGCRCAECTDYE